VRRTISLILVIASAILLQTTLFAEIRLLGAKPELLYLVTIALALLDGPAEGAVAGFFCGMAQDFMLNQPKGITALTLTLLGYAIGLGRTYIVSASPLLPTMLVALATFGGVVFYGTVSFLLGQLGTDFGYLVRVALLTGLYGGLLTPIAFPVIRRLSETSKPRRVVRF